VNASVLEPHLRTEINRLIGEASAKAEEQEAAERASGKKLFDSPKATLLAWPAPLAEADEPKGAEHVHLLSGSTDHFKRCVLQTGETSYLTARRTWKAYVPVMELLRQKLSVPHDKAERLGPSLFPYVYGVVTVLRRYEGNASYILVGVRSQKLAGMNVGMASFPGGLVDPGEPLKLSGPRELFEEGMRGHIRTMSGFAFEAHPDCPSITFSMLAETESREVLPSYEWEGRSLVWAEESAVWRALREPRDNHELRAAFGKHGIVVAEDLRFAPDVSQALSLLKMFAP
jgi:ADP-ribose pyrophosphatase YjhB (NUDIX family)